MKGSGSKPEAASLAAFCSTLVSPTPAESPAICPSAELTPPHTSSPLFPQPGSGPALHTDGPFPKPVRRIRAGGCCLHLAVRTPGRTDRIPSPPSGRMLSPKALMADPGTKIRGGKGSSKQQTLSCQHYLLERLLSVPPVSSEPRHSGYQSLSGNPAPQGALVGGGWGAHTPPPTQLPPKDKPHTLWTGQAVCSPRVAALSQISGQSWLHPTVGTNFVKWRGWSGGAQGGPPGRQPPAK